MLAAITHNWLRAAGTLAGQAMAVARGARLRRQLGNVPGRFVRPQGRPTLRLAAHWPHTRPWNELWHNLFTRGATVQVAA